MIRKKQLPRALLLMLPVFALIFVMLGFQSAQADAAGSLKISATISRTSIYTGGTATVKATLSGGTAPYSYRVAYRIDNGSWTYVNNYSSSPTASFVYAAPGTYTVRAFGKDSRGTSVYCDLSFSVTDDPTPLTNQSFMDKTSVDLGGTITINGRCKGGKAPYTYSYYYSGFGNVQKTISVNTTASSADITFPAPGYYYVKCIARDSRGDSVTKRFSIVCRQVTGETLRNTSSLSVQSIDLSKVLHINASATGGTQPCMYAYFYSSDGINYTKIAGYTQEFDYTMKLPDVGSYRIKVIAKDLTGRTLSKILTVDSICKTGKAFTSTSTISSGKAVEINSTISMYGSATGGTQPYRYAYYYRKNITDNWTTIKSYCTATEASLKLKETGSYYLRVAVKDYSGKIINKTFSVRSLTDQEAQYVDTSQTMNVRFGSVATITAPNEGSSALYSFSCRKSTDRDWTLVQNFDSNRVMSFRPRTAETYQVKVTSRSGTETRSYIVNVVVTIPKDVYDELNIINAQRKKAGLNEVELDTGLTYAARIRAEEIAVKYSHTRPDGSSCFTVLDEYGIEYTSRATENIAWGYPSVDEVMNAWINSSGHKANILDPKVTKAGIGINGVNWVQIFSD